MYHDRMTKWARSLRGPSGHRPRPAAFQALSLEALEDRRLLTASYVLQSQLAGATVYRSIETAGPMLTDVVPVQANAGSAFDIQLQKSPATLNNPAASAAWDAAAELVESLFFDPITVVIDADVSPLAPGVLAQAGSVSAPIAYNTLRSLMISDAQEDELLPALLPTSGQLQTIFPTGEGDPFTFAGGSGNRATLKALGVPESQLPSVPSTYNPSVFRDVFISFNSNFNFDYDPSDGITAGSFDFVGIAVHEIMHGLGFVSNVDTVDFLLDNPEFSRAVTLDPLDLFRLQPGAGATNFTTAPRQMTPGADAVVFDGVYNPVGFTIPGLALGDVPVSTGDSNGDGNQASHWKTDDITGIYIGIMDPTIAPGTLGVVTAEDLRALGNIGWDLHEPVPPVELSVSGASALEGDEGFREFVFTITASNSTIEPYSVEYTTVDQTATAGEDYQAVSGTLAFTPDGPLVQNVTVRVFGDLKVEENEAFLFRLSNATEPAGIAVGEAVGLILNDDVEVSVGDVTVVEGHTGSREAVFSVTAFGAVNQTIVVSYSTVNQTATTPGDYAPRGGQVTLTPQNPSAIISVPVFADRLNEGNETFLMWLTGITGARLGDELGVATIIDDDPLPNFYVNDAFITTTAAGEMNAVFTVGIDVPSGRTVSVNYSTSEGTAVDGIDFAGLVGTLNFAPGVTTRQVSVPVATSGAFGANKKFYLELTSATNANLWDPEGAATIIYAQQQDGEWIQDNGGPGHTKTTGWTNLTNTVAYQLDYDYAAAGTGTTTSTWNFTAIPNGTYEVFARWVPFSNRATNAPFTVLNNNTPIGTVLVNQQLAPTGDLSNGITWQSLGFFDTTTNTLRVRLANNANGLVVADAIRIVAGGIATQVPEIDVASGDQSINVGDMTPSTADGTDFGSVPSLGVVVSRTFTITNSGNAPLHLSGSPILTMGGPHASDFTVVTQPAAVIAPGGKTTFTINFRATGTGVRTGVVSIGSDDANEPVYSFFVQGTLNNPTAVPLAHNAALPQDVNGDTRVTANDLLIVINAVLAENRSGAGQAQPLAAGVQMEGNVEYPRYAVDVNADGRLTARDLLVVINYLLDPPAPAQPAAAAPSAAPLAAEAVDEALVLFETDEEDDAEAGAKAPVLATPLAASSAANTAGAGLLIADRVQVELCGEGDDEDELL